jgi:hypothetical protein
VGNGTEWKKHLTAQLKARFADLLFPSLMEGKTQPFVELIEAMAESRKSGGSVSNFNQGITVKPGIPVAGKDAFQFTPRIPVNKDKGKKKEAGRFLRLALLSLDPEDRQGPQTEPEASHLAQLRKGRKSKAGRAGLSFRQKTVLSRKRVAWHKQ